MRVIVFFEYMKLDNKMYDLWVFDSNFNLYLYIETLVA